MSIPSESESPVGEEEEREIQPPSHHPSAPSDELFDISTTVDPSYVISLIRKLLPPTINRRIKPSSVDACDSAIQGLRTVQTADSFVSPSRDGIPKEPSNEYEAMDTLEEFGIADGHGGMNFSYHEKHEGATVGEDSWEEYGCILWDLAASITHAELMVQSLVLEVLAATLMISKSPRVMEISLGIIGNLACHEVTRKCIASAKGLVEIIVEQLFLDDTPCLCEACRLLTLCIQGSEDIVWAEALQPEHVLSRILWIAENTLNLQLIEKCVGLLLAVLESREEVTAILLPNLVKLCLPSILVNLLAFEMSKLEGARQSERYSILDLILRAIEALSVMDSYSQELCSNRTLLELLISLIKFPDKIEVVNCCVTAAVLVANILSDANDLVLEIRQDMLFLQGLLDIFPFASGDTEARSALWTTLARLLLQVQNSDMDISFWHQYVSILASKSYIINDELLDHELDVSNKDHETMGAPGGNVNIRATALRGIYNILQGWMALKDNDKGSNFLDENPVNQGDIDILKRCCQKYGSCNTD